MADFEREGLFRTEDGVSVPPVTAEEMREVDRIAVEEFDLGILQMMENAGRNLAENVLDMLHSREGEVTILAGAGGNGGGGLCCARHLHNRGFKVWVVLDTEAATLTGAARTQLQIMYSLHGELDLEEQVLDHLSGYRKSAPVRIGNAAAEQRQLDVYGELVNAHYETRRYGEGISQEDWHFIHTIADHACRIWDTEDSGIWEVRGGPRHFTYSKFMIWVALDRSIEMAEQWGFAAPIEKWRKTRETIRQAILQRGFSEKLNSFVQAFDSEALDATSLLIPVMGLLPPDDPRVQGTIEATLRHLTVNGLVHRYLRDDGLPGREGAFVLCTFWLVDVLILSGQVEKAEELFLNALQYISPLGLFAEEIDPASGQQLGNYPQAFSHIGLMNSALRLGLA